MYVTSSLTHWIPLYNSSTDAVNWGCHSCRYGVFPFDTKAEIRPILTTVIVSCAVDFTPTGACVCEKKRSHWINIEVYDTWTIKLADLDNMFYI